MDIRKGRKLNVFKPFFFLDIAKTRVDLARRLQNPRKSFIYFRLGEQIKNLCDIIDMDGEYMSRVSIGIVNRDNRLLMVKRAKQEENLLWVFPGGEVESGETSEQACVREVYEETGLNVSILNLIGERIHPDTGIRMAYYLCKYESGEFRVLDKNEILEIAYKTREEIFNEVKTDIYEPVKKYIMRNIK